MTITTKQVLRTYVTLTLLSTFASSFIWGINTLFLLSAGLSITQAFAANAFFTVGQVLFEVPTGVVADTAGRRVSYLLGSATLFVFTLFYLVLWHIHGPFWLWAVASMGLGLGFTFFSGATEAWLVDALKFTNYKNTLESAFGRGQIASGIAMLSGTVAGGIIAQATNVSVPYILRTVALGCTFFVALWLMKDVGFTPRKGLSVGHEVKSILKASYEHGFKKPAIRWIMISALFSGGVGFFAFYAMQPYLLELYGRNSYTVAGLAASIVAGAQIIGGISAPMIRKLFKRRTTLLFVTALLSIIVLLLIGLVSYFWVALGLLVIWGILFAASSPVRQAYLNELIPSEQRATVLSSDNLLTSAGAAGLQPGLGKVADVWGYGISYVVGAGVQVLALPFILLARNLERRPQPVPQPEIDNPLMNR